MIDISVHDLIKSYEIGNNILNGLSFDILEGEHVGVLGPNGCGKTTLFKIIMGTLDYDEGSVSVAKGKKIGLISQIPDIPEEWTTEDVLKSAQKRIFLLQERMETLAEMMESDNSTELLDEYDRLLTEFTGSDGYNADIKRNKVANGLDIPSSMRKQKFRSLSGGEKTRVNLARLILEDTDILLLDEPTNHLDMESTEWLEEYVKHFRGTVLTISHDRYYLDEVCQRCIEICEGTAEFYSGNYSFYVVERQKRFEEKMKQYEKDQEKIEQLTRAADQMHLWAFMGNDKLHKRAFAMEKRIARIRENGVEKPKSAKKLDIRFKEAEFHAENALVLEHLSKSYDDRILFSGVDLKIGPSEHIALLGNNGTGKTSLLKIILGQEPQDFGNILFGPSVKIGYLPQIIEFDDEARTCYDTMLYEAKCQPQQARDRLAAFGFRGDSVFTPVSSLSGGERSRLKLCIEMGKNINFLILDEPTNHLDIASREWIEEALSDYEETLLFVSHDRYFIDQFATRIWMLSNQSLKDFKGDYETFKNWEERQEVFEKIEANSSSENKPKKNALKSKSPSKQLSKIEKEIESSENRLMEIISLEEEFATDYQKLMELTEEKDELDKTLNTLYEQWDELSSQIQKTDG